MPTIEQTIEKVQKADSWDKRIAQIRLIPGKHGKDEHRDIYAEIAQSLYVPHLTPDFAYIHEAWFYETEYFCEVYKAADVATNGFIDTSESDLARVIEADPRTLLIFRTIIGFTKEEFAHTTRLVAEASGLKHIGSSKVDTMERDGSAAGGGIAIVVAKTLTRIIDGTQFGRPAGNPKSKQAKPDTQTGWLDVQQFAADGVPYGLFLHQRHYGGAFRQILDATSSLRGNLLEDGVEALFKANGIPCLRTGGHDQGEISARFEITVAPSPDFVIFDASGTLRAMLECKTINNGGTSRDKAPRFNALRTEAMRLGGIPLVAVLGGLGWARVNDALGPVVRDTDGRVFTLANLNEMLQVAPFPSLIGTATT